MHERKNEIRKIQGEGDEGKGRKSIELGLKLWAILMTEELVCGSLFVCLILFHNDLIKMFCFILFYTCISTVAHPVYMTKIETFT